MPRDAEQRSRQLAVLALVLVAVFVLSLAVGSVRIPFAEVLRILGGGEGDAALTKIVLQFRLPKALTALFAGASLAVSGLMMQTLFRNPLAGPSVLGISSGASLGVAVVVLATGGGPFRLLAELGHLGDLGTIAAASLGAAGVLGLVVVAARRTSTLTLLILGLLFGYVTSALVTVLMHFSLAERIQAFVVWSFGSFGGVTRGQLVLLAPVLVAGLAISQVLAKPLNALLLGESYARTLGLEVDRARVWILAATALLAGSVTAFCGPIAFLGVAVPHLARGVFHTSDHRVLIPGTALIGAVMALVADFLAQLPGSQAILPLNAVTALLGVPVILAIVLRHRTLEASFER